MRHQFFMDRFRFFKRNGFQRITLGESDCDVALSFAFLLH